MIDYFINNMVEYTRRRMLAATAGIAVGIGAYLFGSLATVSRASTGLLLAMTVLVVGVVTVAYRPLVSVAFDEVGARAAGLSVGRYNRLLVVLTAVVVVGSMQIMGAILVAAMLVVPVAAATAVSGVGRSVVAAVAAGQLATLTGTTLSYSYDIAAGGGIALVAIGIFAVVRLGVALRSG